MRFAEAIFGTTSHSKNRRHRRLSWPSLKMSFDGDSHQTTDWSLGGVLVAGYFGSLAPGDEVEGTLQVMTDTNNHPFKAVVVRRDSGGLALNFTELSHSALSELTDTMAHHGM